MPVGAMQGLASAARLGMQNRGAGSHTGRGTSAGGLPRPAYSWRTRCLEPVAVQSGVAEAGRAVAMSRTSVSGNSSVDLGPGTVANSRHSSLQRRRTCRAVTRARTPPLQTRERNRQKLESAQQETSTTNLIRNLPTPCRSRLDKAAAAPQTPRVASSRNLQQVGLESALLEKLAKQCEKAPVAINDSMVATPRSVD